MLFIMEEHITCTMIIDYIFHMWNKDRTHPKQEHGNNNNTSKGDDIDIYLSSFSLSSTSSSL